MPSDQIPVSGPAVTIRPATAGDLPAILEWERLPDNAAFIEVWPADRHRDALLDPGFRYLVIETGGHAAGYVILGGIGGARPVVEFRRIVVAEKGHGIGGAAVARVLELAFGELDAAEVWLDFVAHNERARHVYAKHGFRVDPTAELWAEIDGKRTPLVKMRLSRAGFVRLGRER